MTLESSYDDAVRHGTVTELPDTGTPPIASAVAPPPLIRDERYADVFVGRFEDNDPPGCPR
ncbi:MAG TPA: hypothetical protein VIS29_04575 [Streptomyces sp.]